MSEELVDGFGRVHRDLRISVTDRCNFRCRYCMPAEGMTWQPRHDLLTFEEIERLARLFVARFGVTAIRLTGGEPTQRAHLPLLVSKLAALGTDLAMSTNAASLRLVAHDLAAAGLQRVNISCDSLVPERFAQLTGRDALAAVLDGVDAALDAGLGPVKLNVVMMRGVNDDEAVAFAEFGRSRNVTVRFIEFMPLDATGAWTDAQVVPAQEIITAISAVHPLEPVVRGHEPAERWRFTDGRGEIGVVPSVTRPFCATCDRVRLTADGQLRTCLFAVDEVDLRGLLRAGADDDAVAKAISAAVADKWEGHSINRVQFIRPRRSMSQIGG